MRDVVSCAREVLSVFQYGPHFTPEQNQALASLRASLEHAERETLSPTIAKLVSDVEQLEQARREHNDAIERLEVWQGNQEQEGFPQQFRRLQDELERLSRRLEG